MPGYLPAVMDTHGPTEGISYSPRPGFTRVGGVPTGLGPVVVHVDGSPESLFALRSAAGQAMTRGTDVVVIDATGIVASDPEAAFEGMDDRERAVAAGIIRNHHVEVLDAPDEDPTVDLYLDLGTSLLVLAVDEVAALADQPERLSALVAAPFDLMLLTAGAGDEDLQIDSSATNAASILRSQAL
jgi:hypothetical protein